MPKTKHLAVYDYGQGAVWMFFLARSPNEIAKKYPEVKVVLEGPEWLKGDHLKKVEARTFDIDDPPTGWLESLAKERGK